MDLFELSAVLRLDTSEYEKALATAEKEGQQAVGRVSGGQVIGGIFGGIGKVGSVAFRGLSAVAGTAVNVVKSIGKAAVVAAGSMTALGAAFTPMVRNAVRAYSNYEQLVGGVQTLFKENSALVVQDAQRAYRTAGLSANEYMETVTSFAASMLQGVGGDTLRAAEMSNRAVTDMADNANKFGTDMEAVQNAYRGFSKQNFTMLDNLKLGYGGTKSEMERLLKDANELNRRQGRYTNYTIDNFADIVNAIHDVQEAMGVTGTTAEEASTTIQGSCAAMKASWDNVLTTIASPNAGRNTPRAIEEFVASADTYLDNLIPAAKRAIAGVSVIVQELAPRLSEEIPQLIKDVLPTIIDTGITVGTALIEGIWNILTTTDWSSIFRRATSRIKTSLASLLGIDASDMSLTDVIVEAVGRASTSISNFFSSPETKTSVNNFVTNFGTSIERVLGALDISTLVGSVMPVTIKLVGGLADLVLQVGGAIVDALTAALSSEELVPGITTFITNLINTAKDKLPGLLGAVTQLASGLINWLRNDGWSQIVGFLRSLIVDSGNHLSGISNAITTLITDIFTSEETWDFLLTALPAAIVESLLIPIDMLVTQVARLFGFDNSQGSAFKQWGVYSALEEFFGLDTSRASRWASGPSVTTTGGQSVPVNGDEIFMPDGHGGYNMFRIEQGMPQMIGNVAAENLPENAQIMQIETPVTEAEAETAQVNSGTTVLNAAHVAFSTGASTGALGQPDFVFGAESLIHPSRNMFHAKGLWNVPYDSYYASLHRGEMVLTASQARDYRDGGGMAAVVSAIEGLRNDIQNIKMVVGQRVFGETVVDYSGKRMRGYIGQAENKAYAGYGWG